MNIKFSKGEIVRFSKKEIEQGRPKNDFIVCGFYLSNKDSLTVNYQISDGGEYVVLVTEDQIVLSSVEKSNIQKIIYIFKNISKIYHKNIIKQYKLMMYQILKIILAKYVNIFKNLMIVTNV